MRLTSTASKHLALLAALTPSILAFKNASPFLILSSYDFPSSVQAPTSNIAPASSFLSTAKDILSSCASDVYVLVHQPGLDARDLRAERGMPHLRKELEKDGERGRSFVVEYVVQEGEGVEELEEGLKRRCEAEMIMVDASTGNFPTFDNMKPKIVRVDFPALPAGEPGHEERLKVLKEHDAFLYSMTSLLPSRHTIILTSTPNTASRKAAATSPKHQDLKRRDDDPSITTMRDPSRPTTTVPASAAPTAADNLFGKYQFFTEGILMGYVALFFLMVMLIGALNSITSLQISYKAFEKDGSQQGKKGQ